MRPVILFSYFFHQYLFKPDNTDVFFLCLGWGRGSMTGQNLGQVLAVSGAPSDVFNNYSSSLNGL